MAQKDDVQELIHQPSHDHIDRATYFEQCWPNSLRIKAFQIERLFVSGDEAFVLYELVPREGKSFRNTEFFRSRGGQMWRIRCISAPHRGLSGILLKDDCNSILAQRLERNIFISMDSLRCYAISLRRIETFSGRKPGNNSLIGPRKR